MTDSIRMMDLAALSRTLDQFRGLDPEHRLLADRMAVRAAEKHLERIHQDVLESHRTEEARVDEHTADQNRKRRARHSLEAEEVSEPAQETVPESDQGHLLDIKV